MQTPVIQAIFQAIHEAPDHAVQSVTIGANMVAIQAAHVGLAAHFSEADEALYAATPPPAGGSAREMADNLARPDKHIAAARALGMAAANALIPPPAGARDIKGQDLIMTRGEGKHVCVVGHFPFVERLRTSFASLSVLEKAPRPGDLPAHMADEVIPKADVVALTATSIINNTLDGLLALCRPDAFVLIMGPSTPFAPGLFDLGVDALGGTIVEDVDRALAGLSEGRSFKTLRGVRPVMMLKKD